MHAHPHRLVSVPGSPPSRSLTATTLAAAVLLTVADAHGAAGTKLAGMLARSPAYTKLPVQRNVPDFSIVPVEKPEYAADYAWILDGRQKNRYVRTREIHVWAVVEALGEAIKPNPSTLQEPNGVEAENQDQYKVLAIN
jgi:hypothetical protein